MNKREFIIGGCAGAVGTVGWIANSDAGEVTRWGQSESARLGIWQQMLGQTFTLQTAPFGTLNLHEIRAGEHAPGHEQFTLVFESAATMRPLRAGTHILRHVDGRPVALYMEPLANHRTDGIKRYAAHFSLLT
jgi:hypothetical protein